MIDPLAEVVGLLEPAARHTKRVLSAGQWRIHCDYAAGGTPFYAVMLEGSCIVTPNGGEPLQLLPGDFLMIPAAYDFYVTSTTPPPEDHIDPPPLALGKSLYRLGNPDGPHDNMMLVGHCEFGSPDAALLVSLLPEQIHIRDDRSLINLVKLVGEEAREDYPGRDMVLQRLIEVMMIMALRAAPKLSPNPGLVNGLHDPKLAVALRAMHEKPQISWTVAELAREAALSRSTFFERFSKTLGMAPMEYLHSWRMALAKKLLRENELSLTAIAERVGYSSASPFSVAFTRYTGMPPRRFSVAAQEKDQTADISEGLQVVYNPTSPPSFSSRGRKNPS
ncbi:AraC family transcriptional regulator [Pokkaliibacter sp. CJK22405]|uniref:AraC family transcriptional regulator n=1 Tax=Pokkaliibacter sp. CJK22405 TaxID=3384615 RepID=UPI0039848550